MKKKLALLLAVSMVLSMLPMNVFGVGSTGAVTPEVRWETAQSVNPGASWGSGEGDRHVLAEQKISIDLSYLAGRDTNGPGLQYEVEITGDAVFQNNNPLLAVGESYTDFLVRRANFWATGMGPATPDYVNFFKNLRTLLPATGDAELAKNGLEVTRDNAGNITRIRYNPSLAAAALTATSALSFGGISTFSTSIVLPNTWFVIAGVSGKDNEISPVATIFSTLLDVPGALTVLFAVLSDAAVADAVSTAIAGGDPTGLALRIVEDVEKVEGDPVLGKIPGIGEVINGTPLSPAALSFARTGFTTFAAWNPSMYLPLGDWRTLMGIPTDNTSQFYIDGAERNSVGNTTPRADNTGDVDSLVNGQFWAELAVISNNSWESSFGRLSVHYDNSSTGSKVVPSVFENELANYAAVDSPIVMGRAGVEFTIATRIWGNARIIVRDWSGNEVVNRPLSTFPGGGLNISYDRKINFHSTVRLTELRFAESRADVIANGNQTIRLVGPRYYRWNVNGAAGGGALAISTQRGALSISAPTIAGFVAPVDGTRVDVGGLVTYTRANPSDPLREELYIIFRATRDTGGLNRVADRIQLNNLWMVAEDRAPMNRDVLVDVSYLSNGLPVLMGGISGATPVIDNNTNWVTETNLAVAYRTTTSLTFSAIGDPLEVRSGTLGGDPYSALTSTDRTVWEDGINTSSANPTPVDVPEALNWTAAAASGFNSNRDYYRGVETQTVLLREDMPNAWSTSFGTATEFTFDDPSVRILGARVWMSYAEDNSWVSNRLWGGFANWAWQGWMNATNGVYPTNIQSISLSPDRLRVFIPSQNVNDIQKTRELRVTFFLSVEAGYEWKHDDNTIYVTVSGAGVGNLDEALRSVPVAYALDPIQVSSDGVVELETNSSYFTGKTQIGDIRITENPDMRFDVQDELWVYIIGDGRRQDVTLTADEIAVVDNPETGLRLRRGYRLHHPQPNYWLDGMVYVIERESWSSEPASITIKNVAIAGNIYPGVEYKIVISGPGVAQNDQYVYEAQHTGTAGGNLARLTVGAFYRDPYTIDAVRFADTTTDSGPGTGTDATPGTGGTGTVIVNPNFTLPTLFTNQPTPGGVENPLIFRRNTTNTTDVGFVSVAAFLDLLRAVYGVDSVPTNDDAWNNATQTATIYGPHKQGFTVTVELTVGSTNVTINGVTMDIADSVGGASGPSGTIRVINEGNRNYLPLRCLAQAFGWVPTLEGNAVTFR